MPLGMGPEVLVIGSEGGLLFTIYPLVLFKWSSCAYFIFPKSELKLYCFIKERGREGEKERAEGKPMLSMTSFSLRSFHWMTSSHGFDCHVYVSGPKPEYSVMSPEVMNAILIYLTILWTSPHGGPTGSQIQHIQTYMYGPPPVVSVKCSSLHLEMPTMALSSVKGGIAPSPAFYPLSQVSPLSHLVFLVSLEILH